MRRPVRALLSTGSKRMYDDFHRAIEQLQTLTGQDRNYALTWLIAWSVLLIVRYIITGAVVFALGRRIINAFTVVMAASHAPRESR